MSLWVLFKAEGYFGIKEKKLFCRWTLNEQFVGRIAIVSLDTKSSNSENLKYLQSVFIDRKIVTSKSEGAWKKLIFNLKNRSKKAERNSVRKKGRVLSCKSLLICQWKLGSLLTRVQVAQIRFYRRMPKIPRTRNEERGTFNDNLKKKGTRYFVWERHN